MDANKRVRIVKREERGESQAKAAPDPKAESAPNPTQVVARQVAAWVKEFQQRRVQESMQSFANLFQRA